jgi:hypothetical protein
LMDALNIGCQWEQTNELLLFYGVDMWTVDYKRELARGLRKFQPNELHNYYLDET